MEKYFVPINSNNLGEYFSRGLLIPAKYIGEYSKDVQSLSDENLVLSKKPFSDDSDCSLEIVLKDIEVSKLSVKSEDINIYSFPLPISRVKRVLFYSKENMERTLGLARTSAFIPERLISVVNREQSDFIKETEIGDEIIKDFLEIGIIDKIDLFDKYLGGLSSMKISGVDYKNYSDHYFHTLGFFNKIIAEEASNGISKENNKYREAFDISKTAPIKKLFNLSLDDIKEELEGKGYRRKSGLFSVNTDNKILYIYSILANYGPTFNTPKDTDSLLVALKSDLIKFKEFVMFIYGLNVGYRSFNPKYIIDGSIIVKNKLASKLDYYTIESIYQYVFFNQVSDKLSYLDELIPDNESIVDFDIYKTYSILDEKVIYDKKPTETIEVISDYYKNNIGEILNALVDDLSKKHKINFSKEQKEKLGEQFESVIIKPFKETLATYLKKGIDELFEYKLKSTEDKVQILTEKLNIAEQNKKELSLLLKETDGTLFDKIDLNRDGDLSEEEIKIFIKKIKEAKFNQPSFDQQISKEKYIVINEEVPEPIQHSIPLIKNTSDKKVVNSKANTKVEKKKNTRKSKKGTSKKTTKKNGGQGELPLK